MSIWKQSNSFHGVYESLAVDHLKYAESKSPDCVHFCLAVCPTEVHNCVLISYLPLYTPFFIIIVFVRLPGQLLLTPEEMKASLCL